MKRQFAAALVSALLVTGCAGQPAPGAEGRFTPGVYQGTGQGYAGEIVVEVEVSAQDILSVSVLSHGESRGVGELAAQQLPAAIIREGTPYVEAVAGATLTSRGIIDAAADALSQAGGKFEQPEPRPDTRTEQELYTDILVAGGGGAGLTGAVAAREQGAERVLLVEKLGIVGGETARLDSIATEQPEQPPEPDPEPTGPTRQSGYDYAAAQRRLLEEAGGEILTGVELTGLLLEDGRVVGARARGENTDYIIHAGSGVLLATGSYGGSSGMVLEHLTDGFYHRGVLGEENFRTRYAAASSGEGIEIARLAGAATVGMKQLELLPCSPDAPLARREGLPLLTPEGDRLDPDAAATPEEFIRTLLALPGGRYYALADGDDLAEYTPEQLAAWQESGEIITADSPEALAALLELSPGQLADTLGDGPCCALVRRPVLNRTLGGLLTDEDGRVMGTDGRAIPGLYAAGSVTALVDDLGEPFRDEYTRSALLPRRAAAAAVQAPVEEMSPAE